MFDFVMQGKLGIPTIVEYLNAWQQRLEKLPSAYLVRYEDLRAEPVAELRKMMAFLEQPFSQDEIIDAVDFASFENLKQKERENFFHNSRLAPRDADDPDSYKVRRAKVGGFRDYFDDTQVIEMESYLQRHLSPRYGYTSPI
jgi:DNA-binding NtrC family response regulator